MRMLSKKILIQMDNCVRENKNKYVFGFLSLLVEKNIFTEVSNVVDMCLQLTIETTGPSMKLLWVVQWFQQVCV